MSTLLIHLPTTLFLPSSNTLKSHNLIFTFTYAIRFYIHHYASTINIFEKKEKAAQPLTVAQLAQSHKKPLLKCRTINHPVTGRPVKYLSRFQGRSFDKRRKGPKQTLTPKYRVLGYHQSKFPRPSTLYLHPIV